MKIIRDRPNTKDAAQMTSGDVYDLGGVVFMTGVDAIGKRYAVNMHTGDVFPEERDTALNAQLIDATLVENYSDAENEDEGEQQ